MCSLRQRTDIKEADTQGWFLWPPPLPSQKSPLPKKQEKLQFVGSISDLDSTASAKFSAAELKEHLEKIRNVKPG
jgi:hypothetical protein